MEGRFEALPEGDQHRLNALYRYAQVGLCVNGVTHDLNNYLGAILAFAELVALDPGLTPESKRMLEKISDAVVRCTNLVGELTAVARKDKHSEEIADIPALVRSALFLRNYALNVERVRIEPQFEDGIPSLLLDAPKVRLALTYLLFNAQEACGGAGGTIKVTVRRANPGAAVDIWNSAPPIPEADREKIFAPFYTTKAGHHLGLGLPIARAIAERHGGTLTYDPETGFTLTLNKIS